MEEQISMRTWLEVPTEECSHKKLTDKNAPADLAGAFLLLFGFFGYFAVRYSFICASFGIGLSR